MIDASCYASVLVTCSNWVKCWNSKCAVVTSIVSYEIIELPQMIAFMYTKTCFYVTISSIWYSSYKNWRLSAIHSCLKVSMSSKLPHEIIRHLMVAKWTINRKTGASNWNFTWLTWWLVLFEYSYLWHLISYSMQNIKAVYSLSRHKTWKS